MPLANGIDDLLSDGDGLDSPLEFVATMHRERLAVVGGVEVWLEFDDAAAAGQDAKARVWTENATGRKVWLKVHDRVGTKVFEKPTRVGQDPPPATVWAEEADFAVTTTVAAETSGALASYIAGQHSQGVEAAVIKASAGRLCDPVAGSYPSPSLRVKLQVWP